MYNFLKGLIDLIFHLMHMNMLHLLRIESNKFPVQQNRSNFLHKHYVCINNLQSIEVQRLYVILYHHCQYVNYTHACRFACKRCNPSFDEYMTGNTWMYNRVEQLRKRH